MAERKLIDLTGAPFLVEKGDDGKYYIIGIKLRRRELIFQNGIPEDIAEKLESTEGNERIDGIDEISSFLEGLPEGSRLVDELMTEEDAEDLERELEEIFFPDGLPD
jgi:hypothetical protein